MEPGESAAPSAPNGKRSLVIGLGVALVIGVAGFGFVLVRPGAPPVETATVAAPGVEPASPRPTPATGTAIAPAPPATATIATTPPASPTTQDALQRRLDAIAKAYNDQDSAAAERAIWPNHAVERPPNGQTLERSELLGQWQTEWAQFQQPQLYFVIDHITEEAGVVTAVWDLRLIAKLVAPDGEEHEFELNGTQQAVYTRAGEVETLTRPIVYLGYEQTLDGQPWYPR
jgi:hypothetical protein